MTFSQLHYPYPEPKQLDEDGNLQHFLTIEGLPAKVLHEILERATSFLGIQERAVKKVPLCRGKVVANVFFENSTRTRTTFELAAKRLSADVINLNIATSSTRKGESLTDTLHNLEAMGVDMFVIRHASSGAPHFCATQVHPGISVINAGDGRHAHPTQGMLDMLTISQYKSDFSRLKVAIVGDILHSRVARSQIQALSTLGTKDIRLAAPRTLLPVGIEQYAPVTCFTNVDEALNGVDVILMLRIQHERMNSALLPSGHEYFDLFGLDRRRLALAEPDAIVLHPGPINRGIEISSDVADGSQSVILEQVTNGIAIRMAVISMCLGTQNLHNFHSAGLQEE